MPTLAKRLVYPELRDGLTINSGSYTIVGSSTTRSGEDKVTIKTTENPAHSEKQRKAMAIAEHHPEKLCKKNKGMLKMSKEQLHEYASKKGKKNKGKKK